MLLMLGCDGDYEFLLLDAMLRAVNGSYQAANSLSSYFFPHEDAWNLFLLNQIFCSYSPETTFLNTENPEQQSCNQY